MALRNLFLQSTLSFILFLGASLWGAEGKLINPITDICWNCLFPIHLGGVNTMPGYQDHSQYKKQICACPGSPPKVGIPLAFWEPYALIDVTRIPFKSVALGGVSLSNYTTRNRGSISHIGDSNQHSFYNVHYYKFPILGFLGLLPGFSCPEQGTDIDITYMSEVDIRWSDDTWSSILNPEAHLFANPPAQIACIPDCLGASINKPLDELFWCGGCSGSLYPFMGHVSHHIGQVQASHLLVHRLLAKMHAEGMLLSADDNFCDKTRLLRVKKSLYKTQLTYPVANTEGPCHRLGKSDILWGAGKTSPYRGEDFVYLVWAKKHCCLDAVQPAAQMMGAP